MRATIERDGLLADLEAIGGEVLANACGPCIGQWDRTDLDPSKVNTIVTSYNRNFPKRNDGNANTLAFVTSPETVVAYALAGTLDFDPLTDTLTNDGRVSQLDPPVGEDLPGRGLRPRRDRLRRPARRRRGDVEVVVSPDSDRLQLLEPFAAWDGNDYDRAAGADEGQGQVHHRPHLRRRQVAEVPGPPREHLRQPVPRRRSTPSPTPPAQGKDPLDGETRSFPDIAKHLHEAGVAWCAVGDENYGEGSSREHAAMEPRFRNGKVIFARSFARIHETNLKKQGMLPLTFADPATYDQIGEDDTHLGPRPRRPRPRPAGAVPHHTSPTASTVDFEATHTFSPEQIEWFRAGSRAQHHPRPQA